ncbi:MAG: sensory rhodopsin transducer [bacterium]
MAQNATGEGAKVWIIPDGYLPTLSAEDKKKQRSGKGYFSHESICVVNTGTEDAHLKIDIYFEDREPIRDIPVTVGGERSLHIRLDKPEMIGGQTIPTGVPYSIRVRSDRNIVVQHSRLDTTQSRLALFTTMGYPVG